jgi:tRNA A37 threonylcarbamoyladenosine dehydratase
MLARAGVGSLRLIDFDQVTLSSLNRHAVATRADVGLTKVQACKTHFITFNPHCEVDAVPRMFTEEGAEELLLGGGRRPDYVIDAIDDAATKAALVTFCITHHLPMICSLAAGGKSDPTRIRIGDLSDPMRDPLARKLRTVLRMNGVWEWLDKPGSGENDGGRKHTNVTGVLPRGTAIKVVYSGQSPVCPLEPLTEEQRQEGASNYGAVEHFRVRVMPVLGTVPALFGMSAASFVLCELGEKKFEPLASRKMSSKTVRKVRDRLKRHEYEKYGVKDIDLKVSEDDVAYLMEHVWHMRCTYTGIHMEGSRAKKVVLRRWDVSRPALVTNLILLTEQSAAVHERMTERTGSLPIRSEMEEEDDDDEPSDEVLAFTARAVQYCVTAREYDFERVKWVVGKNGNGGGRQSSSNLGSPLYIWLALFISLAIGYLLAHQQLKGRSAV